MGSGLTNDEEFRPYKGVAVVCVILLLVPILVFLLCLGLLRVERFSEELRLYEALFFGGLVGTVLCLSFTLSGGLKKAFRVVKERAKEYFQNLPISLKFAGECYRDNLKENGIAYWCYFICIVLNVCMMLYGVFHFFELYNAMSL